MNTKEIYQKMLEATYTGDFSNNDMQDFDKLSDAYTLLLKNVTTITDGLKKTYNKDAQLLNALQNKALESALKRGLKRGALTTGGLLAGAALIGAGAHFLKNGQASQAVDGLKDVANGIKDKVLSSSENDETPNSLQVDDKLINDIWAGKYGQGQDRINRLKAAGYSDEQITQAQTQINNSARGKAEIEALKAKRLAAQKTVSSQPSTPSTNVDLVAEYAKNGGLDPYIVKTDTGEVMLNKDDTVKTKAFRGDEAKAAASALDFKNQHPEITDSSELQKAWANSKASDGIIKKTNSGVPLLNRKGNYKTYLGKNDDRKAATKALGGS